MNEPQTVTRPPKRPLTGWIFLLPALLLGGALFAKRDPKEQINRFVEPALPPAPPSTPNIPDVAATAPTSQKAQKLKREPTKLQVLKEYPESGKSFNLPLLNRIVFVPDDNGHLRKMVVRHAYMGSTAGQVIATERMATLAVGLLLDAAPQYFPPKTKLTKEIKMRGDVAEISLNKAFAQSNMWQSEEETQQTVYAIVNTAAANSDGQPIKSVQLLIEGKPVESLGEFDASGPIEPNMELVAK